MTTLIVKLTPGLAKRLARAADALGLSHEDMAREALRLFVRSIAPELQKLPKPRRGRDA